LRGASCETVKETVLEMAVGKSWGITGDIMKKVIRWNERQGADVPGRRGDEGGMERGEIRKGARSEGNEKSLKGSCTIQAGQEKGQENKKLETLS